MHFGRLTAASPLSLSLAGDLRDGWGTRVFSGASASPTWLRPRVTSPVPLARLSCALSLLPVFLSFLYVFVAYEYATDSV